MQTNIFKIVTKKKNDKQAQESISSKQQSYKGKAWKRDNNKREIIFN